MSAFTSPLLLERYEFKFLIPMHMIEDISRYVEIYCELDPYSQREEDHFYKVNNIYLDSPNYLFLQRRLAGIDHRFNLRIRSYGDSPVFPFFCEAKHKTLGVVKKRRAKIYEDNWNETFDKKDIKNPNNEVIWADNTDYKNHFLRLAFTHNAAPKIFTQYRRKAYASIVDEYARVTFDIDLKYQKREEYDLTPDEANLNHYDNPLKFYEDNCVILELKCTTQVPLWFMDMITQFGLKRTSFSKYVTGIQEILGDNIPYVPERIVTSAAMSY